MTAATEQQVRAALEAVGVAYEVLPCDPEFADTAVYCEHYGYSLWDSANTLVVGSKTGAKTFVACVVSTKPCVSVWACGVCRSPLQSKPGN